MVSKIESGIEVTFSTGEITKVLPPCDIKDQGYWYCTTHKQAFSHNWDKDTHIHRGKHVLGWFCLLHGLEQP